LFSWKEGGNIICGEGQDTKEKEIMTDNQERKKIAEWELKNDTDNDRLLQATELLLRFKEQHGRKPKSIDELEAWVAEPSSNIEKPIRPRNGLELPKENDPLLNMIFKPRGRK
jgi:hypothetical protein